MVIGTYISIITLNVSGLNVQPNDTDCLNGYKNKTHIYAFYKKKSTSNLKTYTDWKWEDRKNIFCAKGKQKKAGVASSYQKKIDMK